MTHAFVSRRPVTWASGALARVAYCAPAKVSRSVCSMHRPARATIAMVGWTGALGDRISFAIATLPSAVRTTSASPSSRCSTRSPASLSTHTPFDTFSSAAHTANAWGVTQENRHHLQRLMEAEGFVNYDQEWWHYTYDVPIRCASTA